jgi:hypothetical protein
MSLIDTVAQIMASTKIDVIRSYKDKGLKASGKFERGLRVKVVQKSTGGVRGELWGPDHTIYMQHGRRSNKEKTWGQVAFLGRILEQWVEDKDILVNPYAAAYKIVHEGIRVPNKHNPGGVISDVINEQWRGEVLKKIGALYKANVRSDLLKQFK